MPVLFGIRRTTKDPNDNKHGRAASIVWSIDVVCNRIESKEKMNTATLSVILMYINSQNTAVHNSESTNHKSQGGNKIPLLIYSCVLTVYIHKYNW